MPTRDSVATGLLKPKMLAFVAAWRGDAIAAATAAGYKNPKSSAEQLMSNPVVVDAIRKQQDILLQETAKRLAKEINFCRADVLNRIWEIANPTSTDKNGPSFETQLKAAQALAEIFDNDLAQAAAVAPQLAGKSQAEINLFLATGCVPENGE